MAWVPLVEPNPGWKDQGRLPGRGSTKPVNIDHPAEAGADLPGRRISKGRLKHLRGTRQPACVHIGDADVS